MKGSKPKVLFVLHLPPPIHGAAMMGKYIHDSKLINETFDCRYIDHSASKNVSDVGKFSFFKFFFQIKTLWRICKNIVFWKPDVTYYVPTTNSWVVYKDALTLKIMRMCGAKNILLHLHNKGVEEYSSRFGAKWAFKRIFKKAKVILLSERLYSDISHFVKKENTYVCPNGIPETQPEEPSAHRDNDIPHLLFLSNLQESKGVLLLLDACKILKNKGYSFVCDFIGGESKEIDAARFAREVTVRRLNEVAVYQGRKYNDEKNAAFDKADIFVFPTYYSNECFPLVLLEAMEHKLPIISTNEGAIHDIVKNGENGLILDKPDKELLAKSIIKLLDSKDLREKMGEQGYKLFKENYTLIGFENKLNNILIKNNNGGGHG